MAAFTMTPSTFAGTALTGSPFASVHFLMENGPGSTRPIDPVEVAIIGLGSSDVRGQPKPTTWRLRVNLSSLNQTDIATFHSVFSEELGVQYLRVTDGDGTTWRVAVRVIGIDIISSNRYDVILRVSNPVFEQDTLTTVQNLNVTNMPVASPSNFALTNGGTRKCRPELTILPDANKNYNVYHYKYVYQGFFVSRQPLPGKVGVYLTDVSGAASRLATNTSATGATVLQTTGLTSITVDIAAAATTITLASSASWPTDGMGYLTDSRGNGFHDQFYYVGISGNVLQNVVWLKAMANGDEGTVITGGGIAHTQVQETAIQPSGVRVDAWDLSVRVDDAPVEAWPVAWNTASSDGVIAYDLGAAISVTIREAMTAGSPAVGAVLYFNESVADLPPVGFLALNDEIIHYSAKVGTNGVRLDGRGLWGTTAAIHVVSTIAYANPHHLIVAVGKATATAPNRPASRRPCFQLAASSNQKRYYGDEANDASTIFFNPATPDRPEQFVPGFDTDGNTVSPLMSISAYTTALTFKDDVPGDGSPPYNFAELTVPQGIDAGLATAIVADWTPAAEILNLEMFARDAQGVLKLIDQLQQSAAAANRSPASFTNNAYALKLKGRYNTTTGIMMTDTTNYDTITYLGGVFPNNDNVAQQFIIEEKTAIDTVIMRLATAAAGTQDIQLYILKDNNNLPGVTGADVIRITSAVSIVGTTPTLYRVPVGGALAVNQIPRLTLEAGTYWLLPTRNGAAVANIRWYRGLSYSQNGRRLLGALYSAGAWSYTGGHDFKLCSIYNNESNVKIQGDQPLYSANARTATTASFDGVEITLEPSQSVYVHRVSAFINGATAGTLHHIKQTVTNTTTGDTLEVDKWAKISAPLVINCGTYDNEGVPTVTYTEDSITYDAAGSVTPSNRAEYFPLAVGANAVTISDPAMVTGSAGQEDLTFTYRGAKV